MGALKRKVDPLKDRHLAVFAGISKVYVTKPDLIGEARHDRRVLFVLDLRLMVQDFKQSLRSAEPSRHQARHPPDLFHWAVNQDQGQEERDEKLGLEIVCVIRRQRHPIRCIPKDQRKPDHPAKLDKRRVRSTRRNRAQHDRQKALMLSVDDDALLPFGRARLDQLDGADRLRDPRRDLTQRLQIFASDSPDHLEEPVDGHSRCRDSDKGCQRQNRVEQEALHHQRRDHERAAQERRHGVDDRYFDLLHIGRKPADQLTLLASIKEAHILSEGSLKQGVA